MSEPEWVYRQRRQRAVVALAMVIGAIAMVIVLGSAVSGGFDLDGRSRVAIDRPDIDEILTREQKQIEARKERQAARREARAERKPRPRKPRKPKRDREAGGSPATARPGGGNPAAASTPAPAPAPAAKNPAPAQAAPPPQPSPPAQPSGGGPVDPRFY